MFPCPRSKVYPFRFIAYLEEIAELIKVSILLLARTEYFRSYKAQKSEFLVKIDLLAFWPILRIWAGRDRQTQIVPGLPNFFKSSSCQEFNSLLDEKMKFHRHSPTNQLPVKLPVSV